VRQFLQSAPKAHFGLPSVRPGTIAVNVTWMKRGFNACQTHRSMYSSIFNRFPVIQLVSSKVRHFSTFLHILAYPGYAPGTIAVNVTWMERGYSMLVKLVQHVPIYLQPFTSYSEILVGNCNFFLTPLHLTPPLGVFPLEFRGKVWSSEN